MMVKRWCIILLAVFLAVSVPVGAAVISFDFQSKEDLTANPINPRSGDGTVGAFVTGTNTQWNVIEVGDNDKYAYGVTSDPLMTMDGSGTSYDVKFSITGSAGNIGRLWAVQDFVYCTESTYGGSNPVTEYEFSYTGLIPGNSYDLKFFAYRSYCRLTINGVTRTTSYADGYTTFTGVVADENGTIEGIFDRNPGHLDKKNRIIAAQIRGSFDAMGGVPSGGELVSSAVDTPLSWTNLINPDPNAGPDVYVEVYCEQNSEPNVLVASGSGLTSATVDTTALGDFYWRVVTYFDYVDENNKGPATSGVVYYFVSVSDTPVSSVDAGADMITWSGEPVDLSATVEDDGKSGLTYAWSADPSSGVTLTEVPDDGDDLTSNSENPTITITKATDNPSVVTVTVAVHDQGNPSAIVEDSLQIDVYDDACKAAVAAGSTSPSDISGDCVTNLADLALIAESWLIDTKISGPVVK